MTEGGIASWKKKEGETFVAGDVLLEVETDKATIDVEAQDDGVLGKIIEQDGAKNVPVGKIIALLAEEGDDISNLEVPKEAPPPPKEEEASPPPKSESSQPKESSSESKSASSSSGHGSSSHAPTHDRPLFPSVQRLLLENASAIPNPSDIKGTGIRGMLTKGDILAFLGKASGPLGSYEGKELKTEMKAAGSVGKDGAAKAEVYKPLDGNALRQLIVSNMLQSSLKARNAKPPTVAPTYDSILADYLPTPTPSSPKPSTLAPSPTPKKSATEAYFDGLF